MDDRCIQGLESLPASLGGCILTVGNFDGVHLGHRRIVLAGRALAPAGEPPVVVMTFEPSPDLVLRPDDVPQRLTPAPRKVRLLLQAGADYVVIVKADTDLLSLAPEQFIEWAIIEKFSPAHVVEGRNFFFGRGRAGNVETLRSMGPDGGFLVHVVAPEMVDLPAGPQRISSTLIRRLLLEGRVADAARCLGRDYELAGRVTAGAGRGRRLDYPTINVAPGQQVRPADGVYAGTATLGEQEFCAAISIGEQPTFDAGSRTIEAFLIDADGDFYDNPVTLRFSRRLRGQVRFDGPEALKAQMAKDVERVREVLG